mmetsp:Transcript_140642/g.392012  ORF Transcript_140642/g.392012 Transcript_140642/m.392012 type:complete len:244 (-) Transcript_140642:426-1157(-)
MAGSKPSSTQESSMDITRSLASPRSCRTRSKPAAQAFTAEGLPCFALPSRSRRFSTDWTWLSSNCCSVFSTSRCLLHPGPSIARALRAWVFGKRATSVGTSCPSPSRESASMARRWTASLTCVRARRSTGATLPSSWCARASSSRTPMACVLVPGLVNSSSLSKTPNVCASSSENSPPASMQVTPVMACRACPEPAARLPAISWMACLEKVFRNADVSCASASCLTAARACTAHRQRLSLVRS